MKKSKIRFREKLFSSDIQTKEKKIIKDMSLVTNPGLENIIGAAYWVTRLKGEVKMQSSILMWVKQMIAHNIRERISFETF